MAKIYHNNGNTDTAPICYLHVSMVTLCCVKQFFKLTVGDSFFFKITDTELLIQPWVYKVLRTDWVICMESY